MWLRDPLTIEITRNTSVPIGLQFWDEEADAPLNVTGYTFSCRIAAADGLQRIADFPVDVVSPADGEVDIVFDGKTLSYQAGSQEAIPLSGQIIATDTQNESVTAARLILILVPGIN